MSELVRRALRVLVLGSLAAAGAAFAQSQTQAQPQQPPAGPIAAESFYRHPDIEAAVIYPEEGHGWLRIESRLDFAQRVERFLAKNLQ